VKAEANADGESGEGHWEVLLKEYPERLPISRRQWAMVKATARV
jgi:two-component system, LytTR family, response regulator AlgR